MEHDTDLAAIIQNDHREVESLFQQLDAGSGDRAQIVAEVVKLLSQHAVAEEQVVYPAVRDANGGDALADDAIGEHQVVKDALVRLGRLDADDKNFASSLTTVMEIVRVHVPKEEDIVLPRLREAVGDERMRKLGKSFAEARDSAPTRPHPHAPSTPPGNVVAGAVSRPLDAARDKLSGKD